MYPDKIRPGYKGCVKYINAARNGAFYVIETEPGKIVGFGRLGYYCNYGPGVFDRTAELCYFIMPKYTRYGMGTKMLHNLVRHAKKAGIRTLIAHISSLNPQSLSFHRKHGFIERGQLHAIGRKKGKNFGVVWMQKDL